MLVIDASAVAELLLLRPAATRVEDHIVTYDYALHAPHLLDIEVLSALRRVVASGDASPHRAGEALQNLVDLPVERYPHDILVSRVWSLRDNFSAYDATYLALAETLTEQGAPLLTADARFARAARAHSAVDILLVN
jgi:predicted nucleic acid-binding protein